MIVDEGLELLSEEDCFALLGTAEVGRVGITMGALPAIFPVNYRLVDGSIVFRTSPGSKLTSATDRAVVAFEVDDYETARRTGWSVLVVGRAEVVDEPDVARGVEPLADGPRNSIVRIEPTFVSGRRIVHC